MNKIRFREIIVFLCVLVSVGFCRPQWFDYMTIGRAIYSNTIITRNIKIPELHTALRQAIQGVQTANPSKFTNVSVFNNCSLTTALNYSVEGDYALINQADFTILAGHGTGWPVDEKYPTPTNTIDLLDTRGASVANMRFGGNLYLKWLWLCSCQWFGLLGRANPDQLGSIAYWNAPYSSSNNSIPLNQSVVTKSGTNCFTYGSYQGKPTIAGIDGGEGYKRIGFFDQPSTIFGKSNWPKAFNTISLLIKATTTTVVTIRLGNGLTSDINNNSLVYSPGPQLGQIIVTPTNNQFVTYTCTYNYSTLNNASSHHVYLEFAGGSGTEIADIKFEWPSTYRIQNDYTALNRMSLLANYWKPVFQGVHMIFGWESDGDIDQRRFLSPFFTNWIQRGYTTINSYFSACTEGQYDQAVAYANRGAYPDYSIETWESAEDALAPASSRGKCIILWEFSDLPVGKGPFGVASW